MQGICKLSGKHIFEQFKRGNACKATERSNEAANQRTIEAVDYEIDREPDKKDRNLSSQNRIVQATFLAEFTKKNVIVGSKILKQTEDATKLLVFQILRKRIYLSSNSKTLKRTTYFQNAYYHLM